MKLHINKKRQIDKLNEMPLPEFENLSANEMDVMVHDALSPECRVRFRDNIDKDVLDKIGLFRIAEDFIHLLHQEGSIKLTPLGALPKKWVVALYDKKYILEELLELGISKLSREQDSVAIQSARLALEVAGITKRLHGKLSITKKGMPFLLPENRQVFFEHFMTTFADKFMWAYNDLFPEVPYGQVGWVYVTYLLKKFGNQPHPTSFYTDQYLKAFPVFNEYFDAEWEKYSCFEIRVFRRFLEWFGLIDLDNEDLLVDKIVMVKTNPIFSSVFEVDLKKMD